MTGQPWWQKNPERLQREEEALRAADLPFVRDETLSSGGRLVFRVTVTGPDGSPIDLTAIYPDTYPYFKPMVIAPDIGFTHHYNPFTQEVCLLPAGKGFWRLNDRLATLLVDQWSMVIEANSGDGRDENGELLEILQAESATIYPEYEPNQLFVLDGAIEFPSDATSGDARIIIYREDPLLLGVVQSLSVDGQAMFYESPELHYGDRPIIQARWVRLTERPPTKLTGDLLLSAALKVDSNLNNRNWIPMANRGTESRKHGPGDSSFQIVLVAFPDEVSHRELGIGWVALRRKRSVQKNRGPGSPARGPGSPQLLRVSQAGPTDIVKRAPELVSLSDKRIMVVGAGGLGASVICELGRVGLSELIIVDGDFVDFATAVRFPSAFRFAGMNKVDALGMLIAESNPYTKVTTVRTVIGSASTAGLNQLEAISEQISIADLIIDATADVSVQHLLSDMARKQETAYMHAEGSPGVWGGLIALILADSGPCWMCVQHHLVDGTLPRLPASTLPDVQPAGCAEPTYTGTGFDLGVIATQAVRVAVSYLCGAEGYGQLPGNVNTVALRDDVGQPTAPVWTTYELDRHAKCENHQ